MCGCLSHLPAPPTGDQAHNPGMCPDWESNQRPFGSQAGTQSTEPHQSGPGEIVLSLSCFDEAWKENMKLPSKGLDT